MTPAKEAQSRGIYGTYWDYYVELWQKRQAKSPSDGLTYPGDEWGHPKGWDGLYQRLLEPAGVADWSRAVEIGAGSGKYTLKVLSGSQSQLRAYDVSEKFLAVCADRCREWIDNGRLSLHLIDAQSPSEMLSDLRACGWDRATDAVFSIDAMVHVDLQYLVVYLLTAALVLREGGKLVLTLPDVTRDPGFAKLMRDISWTFPCQARPIGSGKFEWLSPDIVKSLLPRFGFHLDVLSDAQRDLHVVASLVDAKPASELEHFFEANVSSAS